MRVARVISRLVLCGVALIPSAVFAAEEEAKQFQEVWINRLKENTGVVYQARGLALAWDAQRTKGAGRRVEVRIHALMRCDERKFRFDVQGKDEHFASLYILDDRGFHTCLQRSSVQWDVKSEQSIPDNSDWVNLYPFLLAHGVVPLPPFESPRIVSTTREGPNDVLPDIAARQLQVSFANDSLSVNISHDGNGLIERYEVARDERTILDIRNTYREDGGVLRLDGFSVHAFGSLDGSRARLDARVSACHRNVPIPVAVLAPPRPPGTLRTVLFEAFHKTADVDVLMSVGEVAQAIQAAVGPEIQVRINENAFKDRLEVKINQLLFEPGKAKLSELLFNDFRRNHLDFYIDPQGIVLIPRNSAWQYAELVDYSAKDYGLGIGELKDFLYEAATLDDWSDVGGRAHMLVDEEHETITVFHTLSDHLRFEQRLTR